MSIIAFFTDAMVKVEAAKKANTDVDVMALIIDAACKMFGFRPENMLNIPPTKQNE